MPASIWTTQWHWRDVWAVVRRHPDRVALVVAYVLFLGLLRMPLWRPQAVLDDACNIHVAEARAWLNGRLDLPKRYVCTAIYEDRFYNVYPPAMTLVCAAILPWSPEGIPHWLRMVLFVLPVPALAYALFRRRTERPLTAFVLTVGFLLGTSFYPVVRHTIGAGHVHWVNHTLNNIAVLVFLIEFFGRRRTWLMCLALTAACWSRQLTVFYFAAVLWMAWQTPCGAARRRLLLQFGIITAIAGALPMVLNYCKFGNPLDSGYPYVYHDIPRSDVFSQAAAKGLFSPVFLLSHAYYMHVGLPDLVRHRGALRLQPNVIGSGIWWTTPLLLFLLVYWRTVWHDPRGRVLLLCSLAVMLPMLAYHATGQPQRGYHRFSLDFLPVWLAIIAPLCNGPTARRWATACVLWSVAYFQFLIRWW